MLAVGLGGGGGLQIDLVAKAFQPTDKASLDLLAIALLEVPGAKVDVLAVVFEEVPDDAQDAMGDSDEGLLLATPRGDAAVESGKVAALTVGSALRRLAQAAADRLYVADQACALPGARPELP